MVPTSTTSSRYVIILNIDNSRGVFTQAKYLHLPQGYNSEPELEPGFQQQKYVHIIIVHSDLEFSF